MKLKLSLALGILLSPFIEAGGIRTDVDFQQYLDYADNKGRFKAGATNVAVYKKDGSIAGYIKSVPDFSGNSDVRGNVTMFNERYGVSVGHMTSGGFISTSLNGEGKYTGYQGSNGITFNGETNYYIIADKRGNWSKPKDFYVGRFNKLVTSTRPLPSLATRYSNEELRAANFIGTHTNFGDVVGIGAGAMYGIEPGKNTVRLAGPLGYKTGGIIISLNNGSNGVYRYETTNAFGEKQALWRGADSGDSGSPLYIYDEDKKQWYLFANHSSSSKSGSGGLPRVGDPSNAVIIDHDAFDYIKTFISATLTSNEDITWNLYDNNGKGTLTQSDKTYEYIGIDKSNRDKNTAELGRLRLGTLTKDLVFSHEDSKNVNIKLADSINLGTGALYFKGNYIVSGKDSNTYWVGAGLDIDAGKKVTWKLKGMQNDSLHKVGKGTLLIQGSGDNLGDASIGEGAVELDQQNGKAFNSLEIVSGRASVKLLRDNQLDFDKLYFGSDGGTLDLNGQSISLSQFNAYDKGGILTNTAIKNVNITLDNTKDDINPYKNLNPDPSFKKAKDSTNANMQAYHGSFTNNLDITYKSDGSHKLLLDGGADLKGRLDIESSGLTLQGNPVLHAYNKSMLIDTPALEANSKLLSWGVQPSALQSDWEDNTFRFQNGINIKESTSLDIGFYARTQANATLESNSSLTLGIKNGERVYVDRLYGVLYAQDLKDEALKISFNADSYLDPSLLPTSFKGDIALGSNSVLNINHASFTGGINPNSNASSPQPLGTLNLDNFGVVSFSKASKFKALNVKSGSLNFDIATLKEAIPFVKVQTASFSANSYINVALPMLDFFSTYLDKNYILLSADEGISYFEGASKVTSKDSKYASLQSSFKNNINFNTSTTKGLRKLSDNTFIESTLSTKDIGFKITTKPSSLTTAKSNADLQEEKLQEEKRLAKEKAEEKAREEARKEAKRQEEAKEKAEAEAKEKQAALKRQKEKEEQARLEKERLEREKQQREKAEKEAQEKLQKEKDKNQTSNTESNSDAKSTNETSTTSPLNVVPKESLGDTLRKEVLEKISGTANKDKLKKMLVSSDAMFNEMINKGLLANGGLDKEVAKLDSNLSALASLNLPQEVNKTMQESISLISTARMIKAANPIGISLKNIDSKTRLALVQNTLGSTQSDIQSDKLLLKTILDLVEKKQNSAWINLLGANRALQASSANIYGVSLGYDRTFNKALLGIYASFASANSNTSLTTLSLDNRSQNYEAGIYASFLGVLFKRGELDLLASFNIGDNNLSLDDKDNLLTRKESFLSTSLNSKLRYGLIFRPSYAFMLKPFLGLGYTLNLQHKPSLATNSFISSFYTKNSTYLNGGLGLELRKYFNDTSYIYLIPSFKGLLGLSDSGLVITEGLVYKAKSLNNTYVQILLGGELGLGSKVALGANVGYVKGLMQKDDSIFGSLEFKVKW
ncbi:S6 family peptidase [Helicobacter sp. 11S02629-2]|uniref:S6 family peptidase n=1 Tax=Helicobacter sp. 11S02629-2 TaxID=1476195 RepID=UPI000BA587EB|nr:S6 family peptidase [Helicobacter sp. 11S02629-2]PAF42888.1 hypothetical protein BKH40_07425 [Helicobacter sp. 11S02629-2]